MNDTYLHTHISIHLHWMPSHTTPRPRCGPSMRTVHLPSFRRFLFFVNVERCQKKRRAEVWNKIKASRRTCEVAKTILHPAGVEPVGGIQSTMPVVAISYHIIFARGSLFVRWLCVRPRRVSACVKPLFGATVSVSVHRLHLMRNNGQHGDEMKPIYI